MTLTQDRLKELLMYCPETGVFSWNVSKVGRSKGKSAGCQLNCGAIQIMLDYHKYSAHRLAFIYMTGFCVDEVDHIDGNPANNSWGNLRSVTHSQNLLNRRVLTSSRTGVKNVSFRKSRNTYVVVMAVNGKRKFIGYRKDIQAATELATAARTQYHGEYARHD